MHYKNIQRVLLTSIKEDDLYKGFKELEIRRYCIAYQKLLRRWDRTIITPFIKEILESGTCWKIDDTLGHVELDRYALGKKLLTLKAEDGQKNLLSPYDNYRIACWCSFEDEIKVIFEEFKSTLGTEPIENLVKRYNKGA